MVYMHLEVNYIPFLSTDGPLKRILFSRTTLDLL